MGATIDSLTRDFSWAVTGALQEHAAARSGVPCPASMLKNAPSARQAFPGSVLRLRDGSIQVVDFTGGVKSTGDATCLMLKPLLGGSAKQYYPTELSETVDWILMGGLAMVRLLLVRCLSRLAHDWLLLAAHHASRPRREQPSTTQRLEGMRTVATALSVSLISQTFSQRCDVQAGTDALMHGGSQHRHEYPWLADEKQLQTVAKCVQQYASGAENIEILPLLLNRVTSERGIFVEIGANDGIHGSNTLMLERCFNWTGLLIEASPDTFTKLLQSQRSATMVNSPSCPNGQVVQMSRAGGAVAAVVDFASHSYMTKWGRHMGGAHERINVTCREMRDIMREAGYAHAHFLSLDVQGAEEVVLRTADIRSFSTVLVEAEGTAVEKNRRVHDLLLSHGFRQLPNPTASRAHRGTGYNEIYAQSSVRDIRPSQTRTYSFRRKPANGLAEIITSLQSLKAMRSYE